MILDMRPVCTFTDFFVICTGRNPRQTAAIWDEVHGRLKQEHGLLPRTRRRRARRGRGSSPTTSTSSSTSSRRRRAQYYKLEELWGDVPAVELDSRRRAAASLGGISDAAARVRQHDVRRRAGRPPTSLPATRDVERRRAAHAHPEPWPSRKRSVWPCSRMPS